MSRAPKENLSSYGGQMSAPAPGKKHRLSRFLGGTKYEENPTRPPPVTNPTDSAYGSTDNANHDIVQVENDGSIPNTNKSQNLALDKGTGEVFDEDTGEVVTVVTTTTTTTTTTTKRGGGGRPYQEVPNEIHTTRQEQPHGATTTHTGLESAYPRDSTYSSGHPELPAKSARRSGEYDGMTSSSAHNFSYPSRAPPTVTPAPAPAGSGMPPEEVQLSSKKPSRLADLKAAAVGLHGVGETLRGTLNSEIDNRFPSRNKEKAAVIRAQNEAVLDRGRREMEGIPHRDRYGNPTTAAAAATHQRGSVPGDPNSNLRGEAEDGSHSAVFGLTPDGHKHLDTSEKLTPPQQGADTSTNDLSSVSNMSTSDRNTNVGDSALNVPTYHPPRGTAVRNHSEAAPEPVTGAPERGGTLRQFGHSDANQSQNPVSPIGGNNTHLNDQHSNIADMTNPNTSTYNTDNSQGIHSHSTDHNTTDRYGTGNQSNEPFRTDSYTAGNDSLNNTHNNQTTDTQGTGPQPGTNQYAALSNDNFSSGAPPKKESTISKLFKRKPVPGTGEVGTETAAEKAERKKYY